MVATLDERLVLINVKAEKKEQVLALLANRLETTGFVRNTYLEAVIEREKYFPTGLPTEPVAIAIPHSDSEHCLKPAIAVATVREPVTFGLMGDERATVAAKIIFMLALDKKEGQAEFLCKFSDLFKNGAELENISRSTKAADIVDIIFRHVKL